MGIVATLAKGTLALLGSTVVVAGALLYRYQTNLIYPSNLPSGSRTDVSTPAQHGMPDFEELKLLTPDGVALQAFVVRTDSPATRPTVLLLHANAGNVGHRLPIAKVFRRKMNCNFVALSYRGYGKSEGTANEAGLRLDAQTALDYILSDPQLQHTPIFIYGQSIGGAVAVDLASRNTQRVAGLIIENTFLSLPKLVPSVMPYLAPFVPYLLHQIWPSEEKVKTFPPAFPVLFLSGSRDELIPPAHMAELNRLSTGKNEIVLFAQGTHNDTCVQSGYFQTIAEFVVRITDPSSSNANLDDPVSPRVRSSAVSTDGSYDLVEGESDDDGELIGASAMSTGDIEMVVKETIKDKVEGGIEKLEKL